MDDTNKIRLVHITLYNFLARIIFFLFIFFSGVYASRFFAKADFGYAQYISWMVSFSWLLFNFGAPATLNRFLAQGKFQDARSNKLLKRFAIVMLISSTLVSLIIWYIYARYSGTSVSNVAVFYLITFITANYLQVIMQARFLFKQLFFVSTGAALLGFTGLFLLLPLYGVDGYIGMFALVNLFLVVGYVVSLISNKTSFNEGKNEPLDTKLLWRTTLYFALSTVLASILWQRTELYFIERKLDYSSVAVYSLALTVITLSTEFLRLIPGSLLSYFSAIKEDKEKVQNRLYVFMRYFVWLAVFVCVFFASDAVDIIRILYTEQYIESALYVRILFLGFLPGVCSYVIMNLHIGLGRSRFLMIQDACAAVVFLTGCWFLIDIYGATGAAWAKSIALVFAVTIGMFYTVKRLQLILPFRYMITSLVLACALLLPLQHIFTGNLLLLLLKAIVTFSIYISISIRMGIIEKATINRIKEDIIKMIS